MVWNLKTRNLKYKHILLVESKIATCYQGKGVPGLYKFDQTEFLPKNALGGTNVPMERYGFIYIPPRCEAGKLGCSVTFIKK